MSTRFSLVRTALLACVFALVGAIELGCADEEGAGLLDPARQPSHPSTPKTNRP